MITNPNWTEADQQDLMDLIGEINEKPREAIKQEILVVGGQGAGKQAEAIREIKEAVFTIGRIVSEAADSMMDAIRALLNKSVFDSRPEPPKAKYPLIRGTNKIQAPPVGSIEVRVRSPTIPTLLSS